MKVYAEYIETGGIKYRRNTLLHFGDSYDLIGSAVLINPGSAKPITKISNIDRIVEFYQNTHRTNLEKPELWHTFSVDPTMDRLAKVFNGWYIQNIKDLHGIIQLFNCYYYKDQNLENAIKNFDNNSEFTFKEHHLFSDKPVYFGWGKEGKFGNFSKIANEIFSRYKHDLTPIYNSNFEKNCFYHPNYINRSYKRNLKTKELLTNFSNLIL